MNSPARYAMMTEISPRSRPFDICSEDRHEKENRWQDEKKRPDCRIRVNRINYVPKYIDNNCLRINADRCPEPGKKTKSYDKLPDIGSGFFCHGRCPLISKTGYCLSLMMNIFGSFPLKQSAFLHRSGTPRSIVSCDDHEHNADSREHQTEGKHRQILHSEQEDTENNPCNGNQR